MAVEDDTQNPLHTGIDAGKEKQHNGEGSTYTEHASRSSSSDGDSQGKIRPDGKRELAEDEAYDALGFCFPWYKKWTILTVIFVVQMSMNFNSSTYSNAVSGLTEEFNISAQAARVGQMIFLVAYAFGCELWAPWSEEFGRWPIMQLSLTFMNIWQIPSALAPNDGIMVVSRFLGGISLAGGSVTLGMTADMWEADDQGFAVAYVVLSSVSGTTIGPFFGGMMEQWLDWRWNFWIQLIFGGVTQILHLFFMYLREPIVLCLSLLSGFSDALIFTSIESFALVFEQWGFDSLRIGLCFATIIIGYLVAYAIFIPDIWRQRKVRKEHGNAARLPERRLLLLLFIAPLEAIGLFGFAWTTMGQEYNHWIGPLIFMFLIANANYGIYMATIDYMVAAYGPYSASATGGNGFARDFLAGLSAMYATPMYQNIGGRLHLQWASTILGVLAILVTIRIYIFYWKGPQIRENSKFAQTLAADRACDEGRRASYMSAREKAYAA
ncbi:hypothetical protein BDW75DRAFT_230805 [Aspergillus navahoensis]